MRSSTLQRRVAPARCNQRKPARSNKDPTQPNKLIKKKYIYSIKSNLFLSFFFNVATRKFKNTYVGGFPGGSVVENLPANAGDTGSSPGLGRSHMPRSNQASEPQLLSLRIWSLCSATRETTIVRGPRTAMKSGPRLPQLEKALAQKRRPNTAKTKQNKTKTYLCDLHLHIIFLLNSIALELIQAYYSIKSGF